MDVSCLSPLCLSTSLSPPSLPPPSLPPPSLSHQTSGHSEQLCRVESGLSQDFDQVSVDLSVSADGTSILSRSAGDLTLSRGIKQAEVSVTQCLNCESALALSVINMVVLAN